MTHELKTWPEYFSAIADGSKKFELRKNDRDFAVGDHLLLREFDPATESYTGRTLKLKVTYLLDDGFGLPADLCIMSIELA